jgi:glycosyltransferase involved in cell wall biosynthesis
MHGAFAKQIEGTGERPLAFFIQDLRAGGAERNVTRILNGIVARGIRTDLVVVQRNGAFFDELDPRINVVELSQNRTIKSIFGLKHYIETIRPTALVSSLTHTNIAAILGNLLAAKRTPLIVIERNHFTLNRRVKRGLVWLGYRSAPYLYPRADAVAAVSRGVRDDLAGVIKQDPERIYVLYNPVVSDNIELLAAEPVEHPWFANKDIPVILGVGRLERQKNFPLLIEAFDRVRKVRPVRLVILGEGDLRAELERQVRLLGIEDLVDLPGFDANPFRYMRKAGLFVMSSDWEGLPTVLIEAMACGAPIVSTDCPSGPREILDEGKLGHLVPTGSVDALAEAITSALNHPGDKTERVARAKEFSLPAAVDRYLAVIGEVIGKSNDDER